MPYLTTLALALLAAVLSLCTQPSHASFDPSLPYPYLTSDTFASIKNTPAERLVLFFHSSPTAATTLTTLNTAARRLHAELPHFVLQYCNGSLPANAADFAAAGFGSGEWLFTSTPVEGIMKYTGPVTAAELVDHVRSKYLKAEARDLVRFGGEDDFYALLDAPPALPVLVKFFEPWCEHCKRLAPTFAISATYFRNAVRHVEVQCSGSADETAFCKRHAVQSYPVLMLFNGETTVKYEGEERSVRAFDAFFEQNVGGYESRVRALRRERAAKKKRAKSDEAGAEGEESVASVTRPAASKAEAEKKPAATANVEKAVPTKRSVEKKAEVSAEVAVKAELPVVARLSALEKEVSEMHDTLRAIQQQLSVLVAQRR